MNIILTIGDFSLIAVKGVYIVFFCNNGNASGSIPLGHSTTPKEKYSEIKFVLEKISYYEHNWIICVDLEMVGFPLGLQCGYTKFPCFLCLWDSRARAQHWIKQD